jgi:hypothetical protein
MFLCCSRITFEMNIVFIFAAICNVIHAESVQSDDDLFTVNITMKGFETNKVCKTLIKFFYLKNRDGFIP